MVGWEQVVNYSQEFGPYVRGHISRLGGIKPGDIYASFFLGVFITRNWFKLEVISVSAALECIFIMGQS